VKSEEIYQAQIAGILLRRGGTSSGRKLWACISIERVNDHPFEG
jgi:hypothetical protein